MVSGPTADNLGSLQLGSLKWAENCAFSTVPKVTVKETGRAASVRLGDGLRRAKQLGIGLQDRQGIALKPLGWLILP